MGFIKLCGLACLIGWVICCYNWLMCSLMSECFSESTCIGYEPAEPYKE